MFSTARRFPAVLERGTSGDSEHTSGGGAGGGAVVPAGRRCGQPLASPAGAAPRKLTWWKRRSEEPEVLVRSQLEGPETGPGAGHLLWEQDTAGFDSLVSDYVGVALGSEIGCDPV